MIDLVVAILLEGITKVKGSSTLLNRIVLTLRSDQGCRRTAATREIPHSTVRALQSSRRGASSLGRPHDAVLAQLRRMVWSRRFRDVRSPSSPTLSSDVPQSSWHRQDGA